MSDLRKMIGFFDSEEKGEVDWRKVCVYFALLNSPVLTEDARTNFEEIFSQNGDNFECDDFINVIKERI